MILDEENTYIENRINEQINFYEKKSKLNKNCYYISKLLEICFGAVIPVVSGFFVDNCWSSITVAILGVLIAVSASINGVFKFQEKWIYYRITIEQLKREMNLFLSKSGVYLDKDAPSNFNLFVENCEGILSSENSAWKQYQDSKSK